MFRVEPRITEAIAKNLLVNHKHFNSAKTLVNNYKRYRNPMQIAYTVDCTYIVGYMTFAILKYEEISRMLREAGFSIKPPPGHLEFLYIDSLDVAKPYKNRGIEDKFLNYALRLGRPIIVETNTRNERFWESKGFKHIGEAWMWRKW